MGEVFRCRKCGKFLFNTENLMEEQKLTDMRAEYSEYTQWFLDPDKYPDWVRQAILKERYTRGKLGCPKCFGRIGSFDFIRKREYRELGPVWVQKSRIDLIKHVVIPTSSQRNPRTFPMHTDIDRVTAIQQEPRESVTRENLENSLPSDPNISESADAQISSLGGGFSVQDNSPCTVASSKTKNVKDVSEEGTDEEMLVTGGRFEPIATPDTVDEPGPPQDEITEKDDGLTDTESAYTCPICLELLYNAHTCRPCLHVYCAPCLRRLCGATPIHTKCPLCRQVISACLPNHEMTNLVKTVFPEEYKLRNALERKTRKKLPPLPSSNGHLHTRFNRDRNRNYVLVHWAGVCFVVLLCVMAISILATTVGMLLWYLWETFMDYFIDGLVSVNGYFDYSWQLIIMILMEKSDEISPELAKMLLGSFGQVLHAVGKFFNRTTEKDLSHIGGIDKKKENAQNEYTLSAFQVDLANYVLVMGFVTYLIYRFARYRQARQVEGGQN